MAQRPQQRRPEVKQALGLLDAVEKAAKDCERPDLAERVEAGRQRLSDPAFHVLVVGEFKQGKSRLVNALLAANVCPVDDDIATAVPTAVRHAPKPTATVLFEPPPSDDVDAPKLPPRREGVPVKEVRSYVTERANPDNEQRVQSVEIGIPRKLLKDGLVVVDTPGVGGLGSVHSTVTIGALPMADAVMFVSDASQEFTGPELEFMKTARSMCPNLLCVLTKTDFYPAWRKILELDEEHLQRAGIDAPIIPVSSELREYANKADDDEINQESGFAALLSYLEDNIVANAQQLTIDAAAGDLLAVTSHLEAQFESERSVLDDPDKGEALVAQLEGAKDRAEELRGRAAKWQQTLNDGVTDLNTSVDYDLRERLRTITQQADESVENSDPADMWDEFEPWLYRRVAEDVTHNYTFLQLNAQELSTTVAQHFDEDGQEVTAELPIRNPGEVIQSARVAANLDVTKMGTMQSAWTGLRGSYMPVLMFGMMGGLLGLAVTPLVFAPIGLIVGRKALKDERERQLTQRRQQAKNAHRKYTEEVSFRAQKDSRDTLRQVQRELRDFYSSRADQLAKSTTESLTAAQEAVKADKQTRVARLKDVEGHLKKIGDLRQRLRAMAPGVEVTA